MPLNAFRFLSLAWWILLSILITSFLLVGCGGGGGGGANAPVTLDQITISPTSPALAKGTAQQLSATGRYSDGSSQDLSGQVSWMSGDETVVTTSDMGLITGINTGSASIDAIFNGVTGSTSVEVTAAELATIEVTPHSRHIAKGTSLQLAATGVYTDTTARDITSLVSWGSGNSAIASVSAAGVATGNATGSVSLSAELESIDGTATVEVTPATLASLTIAPSNASIALGTGQHFSVSGIFTDGSSQDLTQQSTWSSSDNAIATIDSSSGAATSAGIGATTITVSNNGISSSTALSVTAATIHRIEVSPTTLSLALGTGAQLQAIGVFTDNSLQDLTTQVSWESASDTLATVNNGVVTTHAIGSLAISAGFPGVAEPGSAALTVTDAELIAIDITPANSSIPLGTQQPLVATGRYTDQSTQNLTDLVTWVSSDPSLALVDNSAANKAQLSTLGTGQLTIEAHYNGVSGSAPLTVTPEILVAIDVAPGDVTIANGTNKRFSATGHYSNGATRDVTQQVSWRSSSPSIASSDAADGELFQSRNTGAVVISASLGDVQGFTHLTVTPATLSSISISPADHSLALGTQQTLTALGLYTDNSSQDLSSQVTWESSDPARVGIGNGAQDKGVAVAKAIGTATVRAYFAGFTGSTAVTVTTATLSSLEVNAPDTSLYVGATLDATVTGHYSDGSSQDAIDKVIFGSSDNIVASISNADDSKGIITGLASGNTTISASYNGITSPPLVIAVQDDPNVPVSLSLRAAPNVILNNGVDSTSLTATVQPAQSHGVIADGTQIDFTITEGESSYTDIATTVGGKASITVNSGYEGTLSIVGEVAGSDIRNTTYLFSTSDFANVLAVYAYMNPIYSGGNYLAGSWFGLNMGNYSNRTFNIVGYFISNGGIPGNGGAHLPDSPVTAPADLNGGQLAGGAGAGLVYVAESDITDNGIHAGYGLSDPTTGASFGFAVKYTYRPPP